MTMKLKRIVLLIAVCLQALSLAAAPRIVRPGVKSPTTFAIFIDSRSYEAAAAEVDAYRAAVERDGLGTYLLIDEWQNPESVRSEIIRMTEAQPHLEGVVFVGDIPIAMIRDGQHLTSAFKSSQDRDWKDSSVPSDRYYDDPELQFEFLRRDADEPLYFYYSLSPESRQHIASPIYSARIKPPKREGADSDELLRAYLRKVVKAHAEQNELDNLFVVRGHGYNSEAPEAWAGEQIALREQLPALFRTGSTVRFYDFESRWPMKPYLLEKMARKGVDVALCHHHGAPDTQYLNGYRNGSGLNVSIENIKRFLRSKIDGHKDPEKRKAELIAYYGVPEAWCQLSDSLHTADSLLDQAMDVHIEDLYNRPMNPRMVMFDACYNGSFHLDECIAASYIFGPGDCIVTQGNSVNALQDKWPDRYIGLLDCGVRIGQWGRHVHYLETHLIGDPTYRFKAAHPELDINSMALKRNNGFWLGQLDNAIPDIQNLAMIRLWENDYPQLPAILLDKCSESPYSVVRYNAFRLLESLNGPEYKQALMLAAYDRFEFLRRIAVTRMGRIGDEAFISVLIDVYVRDRNAARIVFNISEAIRCFDKQQVEKAIETYFADKNFYHAREEKQELLDKLIERNELSPGESSTREILDPQGKPRWRQARISFLKNRPYHQHVTEYLTLLGDEQVPEILRVRMAEALAWFNLSVRRHEIADAGRKLLARGNCSPELAKEVQRMINRVESKK